MLEKRQEMSDNEASELDNKKPSEDTWKNGELEVLKVIFKLRK